MAARFHNTAVFHDNDPVAMEYGGKTMGNDNGCFPGNQVIECILNQFFRFIVKGRSRFVQE